MAETPRQHLLIEYVHLKNGTTYSWVGSGRVLLVDTWNNYSRHRQRANNDKPSAGLSELGALKSQMTKLHAFISGWASSVSLFCSSGSSELITRIYLAAASGRRNGEGREGPTDGSKTRLLLAPSVHRPPDGDDAAG